MLTLWEAHAFLSHDSSLERTWKRCHGRAAAEGRAGWVWCGRVSAGSCVVCAIHKSAQMSRQVGAKIQPACSSPGKALLCMHECICPEVAEPFVLPKS